MIIGAHSLISSMNPEADGAFLRDVLRLTSVDDGGYVIFGLPPAEVSVHPSDRNDVHQFYLMCDDVKAFIAEMTRHRVACEPVQEESWGLLTHVRLPGGGKLPVYEPRHTRPKAMSLKSPAPRRAGRPAVNRGPRAQRRRPKPRAR